MDPYLIASAGGIAASWLSGSLVWLQGARLVSEAYRLEETDPEGLRLMWTYNFEESRFGPRHSGPLSLSSLAETWDTFPTSEGDSEIPFLLNVSRQRVHESHPRLLKILEGYPFNKGVRLSKKSLLQAPRFFSEDLPFRFLVTPQVRTRLLGDSHEATTALLEELYQTFLHHPPYWEVRGKWLQDIGGLIFWGGITPFAVLSLARMFALASASS